jgi:hypothetical protein
MSVPKDRRGGVRYQASAAAPLRDRIARQRHHDPATAPGRGAAFKRPRWAVRTGEPR